MTDVQFVDTSTWAEQSWLNSGGTRAKKILLDDDGQEWFFKCSERKEARDGKPAKYYKYEFWSEIIAYQLGKAWGLDVLRYDPAFYRGEIGCLSKNMLKDDKEQLIEVGRYMVAISNKFTPTITSTRNMYTFQLLERTLSHFKFVKYWDLFLKTILFDAVIGNTDRHQENWAFVGRNTIATRTFDLIENESIKTRFFRWYLRTLIGQLLDKKKFMLNKEGRHLRLMVTNVIRMAPIYDSGSSMARELNEDTVSALLTSEAGLIKYIAAGKAEIHWKGKKLSHFDFISELLNSSYIQQVKEAGAFISKVDSEVVKEIINTVDSTLPENLSHYKIPQSRKDLICNLIILRAEKLKKLIYD